MPGKKDKDKTVLNKMMKACQVIRGLIVSVVFDPIQNMETERVYVPEFLLESILTIMHVRLSHPLPTQLQRTFERHFIAFRVQSICDTISSECSFCAALSKFPKELDDFNPSPGPLHPGTHMNIDIMQRAGQSIVVNCDRFSNFVTACIAQSQTRVEMINCILATVTPIRHGSNVQVRTDRAKAFSSLADNPDPQLAENGITMVLGDAANPNKNAAVDKMMQELEGEIRRLSPDGQKLSAGTLSQAVNTLNNRTRGHGLTASQVHFSRDAEAGTNLRIQDEKLWQVREDRKEALRKAPSAAKPVPVPGQTVFIKGDGTKHTARQPFLVTNVDAEKVTMQKMANVDGPSTAPPRITSYKKRVDPKFLYIPPHRRIRRMPGPETPHRWPGRPQLHARPPPSPPRPPPRPPQRNQTREAPARADLEVEVIFRHQQRELEERPAREEHQLRLRPINQLLAPVQESEADEEAGGGDEREDEGGAEGNDDEDEVGAVIHERLPALIQGPRPRRRPPMEQWIIAQHLQQQPPPPIEPQADQEPERDERHLTGSGRLTKPPDFYGVEKGRTESMADTLLNNSMSSTTREETPPSPTSQTTCSPTPPSTAEATPISTPATSPDTSMFQPPRDSSWLLPPMPCSLTKEEREGDPIHRHRHWSFTAPGCYPSHPRFLNWFGEQKDWDPGPRRGSTGGQ